MLKYLYKDERLHISKQDEQYIHKNKKNVVCHISDIDCPIELCDGMEVYGYYSWYDQHIQLEPGNRFDDGVIVNVNFVTNTISVMRDGMIRQVDMDAATIKRPKFHVMMVNKKIKQNYFKYVKELDAVVCEVMGMTKINTRTPELEINPKTIRQKSRHTKLAHTRAILYSIINVARQYSFEGDVRKKRQTDKTAKPQKITIKDVGKTYNREHTMVVLGVQHLKRIVGSPLYDSDPLKHAYIRILHKLREKHLC
jgi:hypothetical protein